MLANGPDEMPLYYICDFTEQMLKGRKSKYPAALVFHKSLTKLTWLYLKSYRSMLAVSNIAIYTRGPVFLRHHKGIASPIDPLSTRRNFKHLISSNLSLAHQQMTVSQVRHSQTMETSQASGPSSETANRMLASAQGHTVTTARLHYDLTDTLPTGRRPFEHLQSLDCDFPGGPEDVNETESSSEHNVTRPNKGKRARTEAFSDEGHHVERQGGAPGKGSAHHRSQMKPSSSASASEYANEKGNMDYDSSEDSSSEQHVSPHNNGTRSRSEAFSDDRHHADRQGGATPGKGIAQFRSIKVMEHRSQMKPSSSASASEYANEKGNRDSEHYDLCEDLSSEQHVTAPNNNKRSRTEAFSDDIHHVDRQGGTTPGKGRLQFRSSKTMMHRSQMKPSSSSAASEYANEKGNRDSEHSPDNTREYPSASASASASGSASYYSNLQGVHRFESFPQTQRTPKIKFTLTKEQAQEVEKVACRVCGRVGFKRIGGIASHEASCIIRAQMNGNCGRLSDEFQHAIDSLQPVCVPCRQIFSSEARKLQHFQWNPACAVVGGAKPIQATIAGLLAYGRTDVEPSLLSIQGPHVETLRLKDGSRGIAGHEAAQANGNRARLPDEFQHAIDSLQPVCVPCRQIFSSEARKLQHFQWNPACAVVGGAKPIQATIAGLLAYGRTDVEPSLLSIQGPHVEPLRLKDGSLL